MTKIAIISQPEQGVLIDISGCSTVHEATQHLTATLQVQSQFWEHQPVDLNIGTLELGSEALSQVLSIFSEIGVRPRAYFAESAVTRASLQSSNLQASPEAPAKLLNGYSAGSPLPVPTGQIPTGTDSALAGDAPAGSVADSDIGSNPPVEASPIAQPRDSATAADSASGEAAGQSGTVATIGQDGQPGSIHLPVPASASAPAPAPAPAPLSVPQTLYLRQTLRSGQTVSHKGNLVIIGDVNAGAEVVAEGDITIWGALRGIAHAGVAGNVQAEIRALRFEPLQLRIAHAIARSPDRTPRAQKANAPETARIVNGNIRISSSAPE